MASKKVTYSLPLEAIKQLNNLSNKTGKPKSTVIADLIMNTETDHDKIMNMSVKLEATENVSLEEMIGAITTGKKFNPVQIKNKIYLDRDD